MSTKSKPEVVKSKPGNGLVAWKQRLAADKEKRMAELEILRETAMTETVDGQEFKVVMIPDNYNFKRAE